MSDHWYFGPLAFASARGLGPAGDSGVSGGLISTLKGALIGVMILRSL